MSIKLTDKEYMVLSQLAYANLANNKESVKDSFKGHTLQYMAEKLCNGDENGDRRNIAGGGCITNDEQYAILEQIAKGEDGNYKKLYNLTVQDYVNNNPEQTPNGDGFVGYAYSDGTDTVFAFTGSEDNILDGNGNLNIDWANDASMLINKHADQFDSCKNFVIENMKDMPDDGEIFTTGHSLGGALSSYIAAVINGVGGMCFDGPGIGQCLTSDERRRLENSKLINCIDERDPVGMIMDHPEKSNQYILNISKYID